MSDVVSVGNYFHVSVVRTLDLKTTAALNRLPEPLHWPSLKKSGLLNLVICLLYSLVIPAVVFPTGRKEMMNQEDFCTSGETMRVQTMYLSLCHLHF